MTALTGTQSFTETWEHGAKGGGGEVLARRWTDSGQVGLSNDPDWSNYNSCPETSETRSSGSESNGSGQFSLRRSGATSKGGI